MKLFLLFISLSSFAMDVNLRSGESAYIEPNVRTRVSCEGGTNPNSCDQAVNSFSTTLAYCNQSYSGGYCAETYWPKYKQQNPSCVAAGMNLCLKYCNMSYSGGYCAEKCQ